MINKKLNEAIRAGDEVLFSNYYEDSLIALVKRIQRVIFDYDEACDIAQDTFVKLWEQREMIDPEKSLDGLVTKMALQRALDMRRKRLSHEKYHNEQLFLQSEEDMSTDTDLLMREMGRRINEIIANMPPQRRKIFEMNRKENLSYNEIADQLGLSYNTVMNHMKLALKDLRSALTLFLTLFLME